MEVPGNQSDPDSASPVPIGGKRHLIITGCRGSGKSTLLREILALPYFSGRGPFPGFTTRVVPRDHVELTDNLTGEAVTIGSYQPPAAGQTVSLTPGNQMTPDLSGFLGPGAASVTRAIDFLPQWTVIDELGYLESSCPEFCDAVFRLFDRKRVIAVLRSQSTPFLDALRARDDVFVYDLDHPVLPIGCVIMASGLGKRFGSNKLMADFHGKPLISRILSATDTALFAARIVVTRSPEVESLCRERNIPVLLHAMPYRNHTVHLGHAGGSAAADTRDVGGYGNRLFTILSKYLSSLLLRDLPPCVCLRRRSSDPRKPGSFRKPIL